MKICGRGVSTVRTTLRNMYRICAVLGSVLHAVSSMLDVDLSLYRDRWRWEFDEFINHFWDKPSIPQDQLLTDLAADNSIDLVVLVSCDSSIGKLGSELLRIWDERRRKFRLAALCITREMCKARTSRPTAS